MKIVTKIVLLALLLAGFPLRENDIDYYLGISFVLAVVATCLLKWRLPLSKYDVGWLVALLFCLVLVPVALDGSSDVKTIAFQALIFFLPIVSLAPRLIGWRLTDDQMPRLVLWLCALKVAAYAPYLEEVVLALTSAGERVRFHDYSGVVVCMLIFGSLLAGSVKGFGTRIVAGGVAIILLAAAAHRSLYVAVAVQIMVALVTSASAKQRVASGFAAAAIGAVIYLTPFGSVMLGLASESMAGVDGNTSSRISISGAVWSAGFDHPFGHGFGSYFLYGFSSSHERVAYSLQHNSFLTYLYYLGWIPFLAIVASTIWALAFIPASDRVTLALKNSLVGMAVFACFNMFLESPIYGIMYWLVFGWLVQSAQTATPAPKGVAKLGNSLAPDAHASGLLVARAP